MERTVNPDGPEFGPEGHYGPTAVAYGDVGDGREVVVYVRMFNTIIVIGRKGVMDFHQHW